MQPIKIKVKPEDFIVEELAELPLAETADYAVYLLKKRNWSTLELLRKISKDFRIPFQNFSYAGRKDKHAQTSQYITVKNRNKIDIELPDYALEFIGFLPRPMGPDLISGNRFEITVRSLSDKEISACRREIELVKACGFANYFDDQRFGSFDPKQGFIGEKIIKKQYNGALKIYLTHVSSEDKEEDKKRKEFFFKQWGNWDVCYEKCVTPLEKSAFFFLKKNPKGFLPILQRIPKEEMSLFFSCFQGGLYNELLRRLIKQRHPHNLKVYRGLCGEYLFYGLSEEKDDYLEKLFLPTASSKAKMPDDSVQVIYQQILNENNLRPPMFNLRQIRQAFFKSSPRKATIIPQEVSYDFLDDDLYQGYKKLMLKFILPRGSYATMFIKRIFSVSIV
jgi:tRNA pseudouridine13 synthase